MAFLDGYKTKIGGVGFIGTGITLMASAFGGPSFDIKLFGEGLVSFLTGLTALGIGGKVQKLIDAVKGNS